MPPSAQGARHWVDRVIGVLLGLIVGLGVVIGFVFYGSEETIDAPRISEDGELNAGPRGGLPFGSTQTLQLVRVENGAPPASGPPRLDFRRGDRARFLVDSNQTIRIEIRGYAVSRTIPVGRSTISFSATKPGLYAVVVVPSQIQVAALRVRR